MSANLAPQLEMDGIGIDHRFHRGYLQHPNLAPFTTQPSLLRKRRAEAPPENNERLSKRMSLLNLEQSGQKLYVPVENTDIQSSDLAGDLPYPLRHRPKSKLKTAIPADDSLMHLDDTKHKVYIYNLDDELSSDNESDTNADYDRNGNNLIFLPDIEKHLRATRIPHYVLERGPLPGPAADKQLVLYSESVPSSLSVPAEQDSVRKAIIEARARARERQRAEREREAGCEGPVPVPVPVPVVAQFGYVPMDAEGNGFAGGAGGVAPGEDPDAMELD